MDRSIYDDAYTHVFIDTSTNEPTRLVGFCMKKKTWGGTVSIHNVPKN